MKKLAVLLLIVVGSSLSGCIAYPVEPNRGVGVNQRDRDRDGIPDRADRDRDGDGVRNSRDARPHDPRRY